MDFKSKTNLRLWTFFLTLVCFIGTYFYYDFYYVEYEALFDSLYSGSLTEGQPFRSIYFLGNIGTSHLYSVLYEWVPSVEWISWILYVYLFVSCYIGLLIIGEIALTHLSFSIVAFLQIFSYFLVFADHNIHFIFTRVSFMVTGISLVALVYYFKEPSSISKRLNLFVFLNFWFVLGTLTRSESATVVYLQVIFFGIYYLNNFKRLLLIYLFPSIFLGSVLIGIAYELISIKEFYMQVEPEIEAQFCERNNILPISTMKTKIDSIKWEAAQKIFWSDPKVVTPVFMRSLINKRGLGYFNVDQWLRVKRELLSITFRFWHLGLLCFILTFSLFLIKRPKSVKEFVFFSGFVLSFWILLAIQTYTVKVNDRSFSPLISIFIFSFLVDLLQKIPRQARILNMVLLLGYFPFFMLHMFYLHQASELLKLNFEKYQANVRTIKTIAKNKILVVNSSSVDYLVSSNKPFHPFDFSVFEKIYISDGFNMPFLPYYRRYLEKECECNLEEFPSFWNFLMRNHQKVVIFSSRERIEFLQKYVLTMHSFSIPIDDYEGIILEKNQKSDERDLPTNLKIYRLGK